MGYSNMVRGVEEGARRGRAHPSHPALGTTVGRAAPEQGSCAPAPQHWEQSTPHSQGFPGFQPLSSQVEADLGSVFLVCCCCCSLTGTCAESHHDLTASGPDLCHSSAAVGVAAGPLLTPEFAGAVWPSQLSERERLLAMVDPCGMEVEGWKGLTHCLR